MVIAIDAKREDDGWGVYVNGGRKRVEGRDAVAWAREAVERGAGEVLLTSMDRDGTNDGYDIELTRAVADAVPVPVIASGGAGELEHLSEAIADGRRRRRPLRLDLPLRRLPGARGEGATSPRPGSRSGSSRRSRQRGRSSASPATPVGAEDLEAGQFVGVLALGVAGDLGRRADVAGGFDGGDHGRRRTGRPGSRSSSPGRRIRGAGSAREPATSSSSSAASSVGQVEVVDRVRGELPAGGDHRFDVARRRGRSLPP